MINEQAFNNPEILNNMALYQRIKNWKFFIVFFFLFTLIEIALESYADYDTIGNYDMYLDRVNKFYGGVAFINANYLLNFIIIRFFIRGHSLATDLLPDGCLLVQF